MFTDFKIAATLLNHFHVPIADSTNTETFLNKIKGKDRFPKYSLQLCGKKTIK